MARKNLDAKFEVIQDTLTNPEYKFTNPLAMEFATNLESLTNL